MVGEEGRGVPTIIEMVAMTRFDCMVGSSALMRQALTQASHHCAHRSVGGRVLSEQPLMQNVLADLALESEASLALSLRMGRALDHLGDEQEAKRKAMAEKIGFDAYGVSEDMPDPVARAIGQLLDHLQAVDGKLDGMCGALKELGSNYCAKDLPELREEDFAEIKDEAATKAG